MQELVLFAVAVGVTIFQQYHTETQLQELLGGSGVDFRRERGQFAPAFD